MQSAKKPAKLEEFHDTSEKFFVTCFGLWSILGTGLLILGGGFSSFWMGIPGGPGQDVDTILEFANQTTKLIFVVVVNV